jgi:hypothetical protein
MVAAGWCRAGMVVGWVAGTPRQADRAAAVATGAGAWAEAQAGAGMAAAEVHLQLVAGTQSHQ